MNLSDINQKIKNIKRANEKDQLQENNVMSDPFKQFLDWFDQALTFETYDPSAMVLSTIDENGFPDSRVVLLKELDTHRFIFYSNYFSKKARELSNNNVAALNFYWPNYARQVRIRGRVEKVDRKTSEAYFASRPRETQLAAQASMQSSILPSRDILENQIEALAEKFAGKEVPCPEFWGGYMLTPFEYEFFQGRSWRMHDRLLYTFANGKWTMVRLAP
jgi:pyridoxamine 5'-phosphate oxidase